MGTRIKLNLAAAALLGALAPSLAAQEASQDATTASATPMPMATADSGSNRAPTSAASSVPVPSAYLAAQKAEAEAVEGENARVFGGRPAEPGAYPFQVALLNPERIEQDDPDSRFQAQFCGGTLMTRAWVLTAAHCLVTREGEPFRPDEVVVHSGAVDIRSGDLRPVAELVIHEGYDPVVVENDVALLRLAQPIQQSSGPVGAVPVARGNDQVPEGSAVVIGWGMTEDGTFPYELLETDVDLVANEVCNDGMRQLFEQEMASIILDLGTTSRVPEPAMEEAYRILVSNAGDPVSENMICAGTASGERNSCSGDSGGPLLVRQGSGDWLQVGIVSWGRKPLNAEGACGHPQLYGAYTRVPRYFDWIARHVQGG